MILFIYGTMRRRLQHRVHMRESRFLGDATTAPKYTLFDGGTFPVGVVGGTTSIVGELYDVPDYLIKGRFDVLGKGGWLKKNLVRTAIELQPKTVDGTVYAYMSDVNSGWPMSKIYSGDWYKHMLATGRLMVPAYI